MTCNLRSSIKIRTYKQPSPGATACYQSHQDEHSIYDRSLGTQSLARIVAALRFSMSTCPLSCITVHTFSSGYLHT